MEWAYPVPTSPKPDFRHLAMLCLPEGAHNVTGLGHVFFTVELALKPDEPRQPFFGVSFYGQLKTSEVVGFLGVEPEDKTDYTRSHVQKGVAIISREPSFWWLHDMLRPAVERFFAGKDFSRTAALEAVVRSANDRQGQDACVAGIENHRNLSKAQLQLVQRFGRNTLILLKLLLLEPRLVLFSPRCDEASSLVLALVSLVPRLLHSFSPALQLAMCLPRGNATSMQGGLEAKPDQASPHTPNTPHTPMSIRKRLEENTAAHSPERVLPDARRACAGPSSSACGLGAGLLQDTASSSSGGSPAAGGMEKRRAGNGVGGGPWEDIGGLSRHDSNLSTVSAGAISVASSGAVSSTGTARSRSPPIPPPPPPAVASRKQATTNSAEMGVGGAGERSQRAGQEGMEDVG